MKIKDVRQFTDGLLLLSKGFYALASSLEEETTEEMVTQEELPEEYEEVTGKEDLEENESKEEPVIEDEPDGFDRATLDKMGYRDLQKVAKDLDLVANGKKEELIARILGEEFEEVIESIEEVVEEIPEEVEEVIEENPNTEIEEQDQEIEEEEKEDEEKEEEEYTVTKADHIANALENYTEEDLADVLSSIGESPKGKRQALLAKIVIAVEDGKLEIDLAEYEEEEEIEEEPTITEARRQGVVEARNQARELLDNGDISESQMNEILASIYADEGFDPKLPLKERKDMLEEVYANLVDDEGITHELEEPYEKDGTFACCSRALAEHENGNLVCKVCSQEYEIG